MREPECETVNIMSFLFTICTNRSAVLKTPSATRQWDPNMPRRTAVHLGSRRPCNKESPSPENYTSIQPQCRDSNAELFNTGVSCVLSVQPSSELIEPPDVVLIDDFLDN